MSTPPRRQPAFLALSCVGAFATAPAHAADPVPAEAEPEPQEVVVNGDRIERTDPKQPARLVDTPRSVLVLPAEVIRQTGSTTLADALRTVPGITFGAAEGGNPIGDRPFIRGFDAQGSTYLDGVRDFAAQSREVFAVEQVQVVRGSNSTLGGRGGAGGSINIVSKLPVAETFAAGTVAYGTDDFKRATLDVNAVVADTVAVRLGAVWHDQDVAGRDALHQRRWGVATSVTVGLGTPTRLTASYYRLESHELPDSGIPYLYTVANAPLGETRSEPAIGRVTTIGGVTGRVDRSTFYGLKDRDFRDATTQQATLRVEHDFGGVTLRDTVRFTGNDQAYIYTQPDDSQGNVFGTNPAAPATAGGLVWRRANTRYGYARSLVNQTDLFGSVRTGGVRHDFAVGAEVAWEKARRGTYVTRGFLNAGGVEILSSGSTVTPRCGTAAIARYNCTSLFSPNPNDRWVNYATDASIARSPIVRSVRQEETQNDGATAAAYAFDSITLVPELILNLGARYDRYRSTVRPGLTYAATRGFSLTRTDHLFNWQAGLVGKPSANASVYASYATSSTPPNSLLGEGFETNALGTTDTASARALIDALRPEKTRSYEVGAKADLFGGRLAVNGAAFDTRTDNARVIGADNDVVFVGRRRVRGVELGVTGTVREGWTLFGGYTHLNARIVDGGFTALTAAAVPGQAAKVVAVPSVATGRRATQTPAHSLTAWTNVALGRLQLGGGAFYTSRVNGGYADNRAAVQNAAGVVTIVPATRTIVHSVPRYWRVDARASYRVTDAVELSVNAQNLTNETYFSQAYTSHYATIAPGRQVFATLGLRF